MTIEEYTAEVYRICAELVNVPRSKRRAKFDSELEKLPEKYRIPAKQLIAARVDLDSQFEMKLWEKITMIVAGSILIAVLLCIAVFIPEPTNFQIFVFRIVLALGAAAFGCVLPGLLNIESRFNVLWIRAGGTVALFVLIYIWNPPQLARSFKVPTRTGQTNSPTPDHAEK